MRCICVIRAIILVSVVSPFARSAGQPRRHALMRRENPADHPSATATLPQHGGLEEAHQERPALLRRETAKVASRTSLSARPVADLDHARVSSAPPSLASARSELTPAQLTSGEGDDLPSVPAKELAIGRLLEDVEHDLPMITERDRLEAEELARREDERMAREDPNYMSSDEFTDFWEAADEDKNVAALVDDGEQPTVSPSDAVSSVEDDYGVGSLDEQSETDAIDAPLVTGDDFGENPANALVKATGTFDLLTYNDGAFELDEMDLQSDPADVLNEVHHFSDVNRADDVPLELDELADLTTPLSSLSRNATQNGTNIADLPIQALAAVVQKSNTTVDPCQECWECTAPNAKVRDEYKSVAGSDVDWKCICLRASEWSNGHEDMDKDVNAWCNSGKKNDRSCDFKPENVMRGNTGTCDNFGAEECRCDASYRYIK